MGKVTVRFPDDLETQMDSLIDESTLFMSTSDAVRAAVRAMLQRELDGVQTGYRIQSTPTEREQAETIMHYIDNELAARNVTWDVVPATEVGENDR